MKNLSEWPRPADDTGIGMHLSANVYDTRHRNQSVLASDMALWHSMGVKWLKVFVDGDSQLVTTKAFCDNSFMVVIRIYSPSGPEVLTHSWPVDLMQKYRDAGARYVEGFNEPELELQLPYIPETITKLATGYTKFADACAHANIIPCTPAFQGDRLESWVKPFVQEVIQLGRRDVLEGSAVSGHWRPGNHPPSLAGPGFVFRSYELWDEYLRQTLGGPLPMLGTEAGYEPNSHEDTNYDPISLTMHADYNAEIATMPWREAMFCQCFWIWNPPWFSSPWVDNPTYGRLPVVDKFVQMEKPNRVKSPEPPIQELPEPEAIIQIRNWCWNNRFLAKEGFNPNAAFQKFGPDLGVPVTDEHFEWGWGFQGWASGIKYCETGNWANIRVISWMSGPKLT